MVILVTLQDVTASEEVTTEQQFAQVMDGDTSSDSDEIMTDDETEEDESESIESSESSDEY